MKKKNDIVRAVGVNRVRKQWAFSKNTSSNYTFNYKKIQTDKVFAILFLFNLMLYFILNSKAGLQYGKGISI